MDRDHSETGHPPADEALPTLELLRAASGRRLLTMHAIIVVVLLASAQAYDGSIHALSHWLVLLAYAACSIGLGLAESWEREVCERRGARFVSRRAEWLVWASTILNAAIAIYIEVEHLVAGALSGFDGSASAVSRLPAFLLLLQTALTMRVWHTVLFSTTVTLVWGAAIGLAWFHSSRIVLGPHVRLSEEWPALLTFVVASLVVIDGTRRLRAALTTALKLEHERTLLARFVPGSVSVGLERAGGLGTVRERHACLMVLDMRGFSRLTRERSQDEVLRALLDVRALAHAAVTEHGGIVDKYLGDGMLAQFVVGRPERQARAALACAGTILARLDDLNRRHVRERSPALRLTIALHAGDVLAGVFDDGLRAEFTAIGPAMNELARLESRAKQADLPLAVSAQILSLLREPPEVRRIDDGRQPPLFAIDGPAEPAVAPSFARVGDDARS